MALTSGIDLLEIERMQSAIAQFGQRFLQRIFTAQEMAEVGGNPASLAARFAAKEAVAKALGTGIGPVCWQEIEILRGDANQPVLFLHGAAAQIAAQKRLKQWSVSLSHTHSHAIAVAVALSPELPNHEA
jgi:holo-[acyl-carrier protein] synthase